MECPYCSYAKSRVTDKRDSPHGIRRRRECLKCKKRFTTYEKIVESDLYVIKKSQRREKFDLDKIKRSLDVAFRKRPVSKEKIEKIADKIEQEIRKKGKKEIPTKKIGEMIMKKIKKIDKVAYIRFASVYQQFKDIDEFKQKLDELQ